MILSCPSCATRYTIDESQLGPGGRTVRCTACKMTWHAEKPEEPIDLSFSDMRKPERVEDLQAVKAKTLPHSYRALIGDKKRAKELTAQGLVWGGMATAALLILALGYFLRVPIVRAFPSVAGAYAMVGATVNPTDLAFVNYTADSAFKAGHFVVTVKAQVKNLTAKPTPVPPVRVTLFDATRQQFDSVLMPAGNLVVAPGATRTLVFDVADPKNMTNSVGLIFDIVAMKKMKAMPAPRVALAAPANASEDDSTPAAPQPAEEAVADNDNGTPGDDSGPPDQGTDQGQALAQAAVTTDQPVSNRTLPALRPALTRDTVAAAETSKLRGKSS